jgi:DNA-binding NarL/FixJ family response regulator
MGQINIIVFGGQDTALHISALSEARPDIALSAITSSPNVLHTFIKQHPHVALLEAAHDLPDVIPLIAHIDSQAPRTKCIVLAHQFEVVHIRRSVAAGAIGYLRFGSNLCDLAASIRLVQAGKFTCAPEVTRLLLSAY